MSNTYDSRHFSPVYKSPVTQLMLRLFRRKMISGK